METIKTMEEILATKNVILCDNIKYKLGSSLKMLRAKKIKGECLYYIVDEKFGDFLKNHTKENIYFDQDLGLTIWEVSKDKKTLEITGF